MTGVSDQGRWFAITLPQDHGDIRSPTGLLACCPSLVMTAAAEVTTLRHYRLGENDPGASDGSPLTTSENATGPDPLTISGAPAYSAAVVANGYAATELCVGFNGATFATSPVISGLTDNFGIEVRAKPGVASGSRILAYNGTTGTSGWGSTRAAGNSRRSSAAARSSESLR